MFAITMGYTGVAIRLRLFIVFRSSFVYYEKTFFKKEVSL